VCIGLSSGMPRLPEYMPLGEKFHGGASACLVTRTCN
jgi:hypothetical protein